MAQAAAHIETNPTMKIVILTQWYMPEPVRMLQELAQTLQEYGHSVTVLTGFPNYPSGRVYAGYKVHLWQREQLANVPVVRVHLYADHSKSAVKRMLNYLSFAMSSSVLGPWLVSRPDVMFVYHPPLTVGLPACILSRLWRIPFVYQIQDMWPETLRATGMLKSNRLLRLVGKCAGFIYKKASAICVISPGFKENLVRKGVPSEKIALVSNWVDALAFHPANIDHEMAAKLSLDNRFNIMFAGNIGEAQGLETIIDAAALLRESPDIQFVVVGDGIALPG
jgi:glycosyltransferase involved in cell wall biosynthesis